MFIKAYRHTKLVIPNFYDESDDKSLKLSSLNNYDMINEKMSDKDQESSGSETQIKSAKKPKDHLCTKQIRGLIRGLNKGLQSALRRHSANLLLGEEPCDGRGLIRSIRQQGRQQRLLLAEPLEEAVCVLGVASECAEHAHPGCHTHDGWEGEAI